MYNFDGKEVLKEFFCFKGFKKATWKAKIRWIVGYPIMAAIIIGVVIDNYLFRKVESWRDRKREMKK